MTTAELREKFLTFFKERGHTIVPSSSLLSEDSSVLFTIAGMQQFKPYFMGRGNPERDFGSKNTVSVQKSFRTADIDEVGDEEHNTFFEMLGNFSFGGYFKEDAIRYAHDFFKEVGLPIQYVTIFGGDRDVPADEESRRIWQSLGIADIREGGREDNFWGPVGSDGPCGPSTEIYYGDVEIWNIVFNEYYCDKDGAREPLSQKGVDTGMGLERLAMAVQGKENIFETDGFARLTGILPQTIDMRTKRIIADHARSIAFLISEGVRPSNKEAGYVLRRLIRRTLVYRHLHRIEIAPVLKEVVDVYGNRYQELDWRATEEEFGKEQKKFEQTLARGLKELEKHAAVDAPSAFRLYESFGLPYEIIKELGGPKAGALTREGFDREFFIHQEKSRAGREAKFGGHGLLLDTGELKARDEEELKKVTRLHTATHLLQAALRHVLGDAIHQDGSDITAERLRFDFTFDRRLTDEELRHVEDWINEAVERDIPMRCELVPFEEAKKTGALYFEKETYPDMVKIYSAIDPKTGEVLSRELCGGPHVEHTGQVGKVTITKQESVGAGVRRIRATVNEKA